MHTAINDKAGSNFETSSCKYIKTNVIDIISKTPVNSNISLGNFTINSLNKIFFSWV